MSWIIRLPLTKNYISEIGLALFSPNVSYWPIFFDRRVWEGCIWVFYLPVLEQRGTQTAMKTCFWRPSPLVARACAGKAMA